MNPKELKILLQARNEMQAAFKQAGGQIDSLVAKQQRQAEMTRKVGVAFAAGGAAIAAAGFSAGKAWDDATKTIVAGTGAAGEKLESLQASIREVAGPGGSVSEAATNIADLNTHLGLMGPELETVAIAAHKAGINTNSFGAFARQMGLDTAGTVSVLDQLSKVADDTGNEVDDLTRIVNKNAARFKAAGVPISQLTDLVVAASYEFSGEGLRGAISELAEEADKGLIPTVQTMNERIGEQTGYVEAAYQAGRTWRDSLGETKDSLAAMVGPAGDVVGAVGSMAAGVGTMLIAFPGLLTGLTLANIKTLALSVSTKGLAAAAWLLHSPLLPIAVAIGAVFAAWKIGQNEGVQKMLSGWVLGLQEFLGVAGKTKEEILEIQNAIDAAINESRDENIRREIAFHSKQIELLKGTGDVRLGLSRERIGQLQAELAGLDKVEPKIAEVSVATKQLTDATEELTQAQKELQHEIPITFAAFDLIADAVPGVAIQMGETFSDLLLVLPGISPEMQRQSELLATKVNKGFLGKLSQIDIAGTFSNAFQGGGGFMGAVKSLASQVAGVFTDAFGGLLNTGIGGILKGLLGGGGGGGISGVVSKAFSGAGSLGASSFMGALFGGGGAAAAGAGAGAGAAGGGAAAAGAAGTGLFSGAAGGFLSIAAAIPVWGWAAAGVTVAGLLAWKMFGKPSKLEKEGRRAAADARTAIAKTLTDGQVEEAAGDMGASVHIAIRDAMLGAGKSIAEAEAQATKFVKELWRAEKEGPEAVAKVKEAIDSLVSSSEDANQALDHLFTDRSFTVTQRLHTEGGFTSPEHRQGGGPVGAGQPYIVGERGPELFVPQQSGRIEPNSGPTYITLVAEQGGQPLLNWIIENSPEAEAVLGIDR